MNTYTFNLKLSTEPITDELFQQLCTLNPELKLETNSQGELIIMSPTGSETGRRNLDLEGQFWYWNKQRKLGVVFDSSTGFTFPNGAKRSPDVSWITFDRWNSLTLDEKKGFAPIAPDFVLELMSPTDNLTTLQNKMKEYINNGVRLGWLINPEDKQVEVYSSGKAKEVLNHPNTIHNDEVLPGLVVELDTIWE
ncbi:MAG: Uma2 family endonuclease [Xenococcaceae cyanobacterium MO_234.B1]|nr:Uma2 family endonuclease [Xenococcaceae cyanobacterium MO_234.B1]